MPGDLMTLMTHEVGWSRDRKDISAERRPLCIPLQYRSLGPLESASLLMDEAVWTRRIVGRLLIAPTVTREAVVGLCFGALVRQLEFRCTVLYYCYQARLQWC